jgi:hypothetical protein
MKVNVTLQYWLIGSEADQRVLQEELRYSTQPSTFSPARRISGVGGDGQYEAILIQTTVEVQ